MESTNSVDSLAILASRGIFELGRARLITAEDMKRALSLATRPHNAQEVILMRLEWDVDGVAVEFPIGEFGCRLIANVELLVVDGNAAE